MDVLLGRGLGALDVLRSSRTDSYLQCFTPQYVGKLLTVQKDSMRTERAQIKFISVI